MHRFTLTSLNGAFLTVRRAIEELGQIGALGTAYSADGLVGAWPAGSLGGAALLGHPIMPGAVLLHRDGDNRDAAAPLPSGREIG